MIDEIGAGYDITVILPHFACPDLLARAVGSIRAQTHQNWFLVIVDDHSPCVDDVMEVRRSCAADRMLWLRTSTNVGPFRIYNRLLPRIASPFLAFQDADDWSVPERFERLLLALDEWHCDVVGSILVRARPDSSSSILRLPFDVNRTLRFRFRGGAFWGATMLCKTSFLRALGGFDGTTKIGADTDFVHRAIFVGAVRNHPEPLYGYQERPDSLTHSPTTGFGSAIRKAYRDKTRWRYYRNLLLCWTGTLSINKLQPPQNDLDFRMLYLGSREHAF